MSSVRSRSPAPALSSISRGWFCSWFCKLRSSFGLVAVELHDRCLRRRGASHVAADDARDLFFLPPHHLGDDALLQAGDIEFRGRRAAEVMEVKVANLGAPLRLVEGRTESVL